ncbi:MAG: hypothetical protein EYC68_14760, partial [Chloroflexota bacterium]
MSRAFESVRKHAILYLQIGAVLALAILILSMVMSAWAQGDTAPPIVLTDASGEYPLAPHLEILRDPTRQLTIEDVASPAF